MSLKKNFLQKRTFCRFFQNLGNYSKGHHLASNDYQNVTFSGLAKLRRNFKNDSFFIKFCDESCFTGLS